MPTSLANARSSRHRVIPEIHPEMAKADLRSPESRDFLREVGLCLEAARLANGWTLDQLAGALPPAPNADERDPRQVQRWIEGKERTQVDVVLSVPALRKPFVIALAKLTGEFEITTTLRVAA